MKKQNDFIRLGGILFLIAAVTAALLGGFNEITKEPIALAKEAKALAAMQAVMPDATDFVLLEDIEITDPNIAQVHLAKKGVEPIGLCFTLTPKGYGGEMSIMAGVLLNGKVSGVKIISHSETAGLGANADKPEWLNQFEGKTTGLAVVKGTAQGNQISAVSSATITSKAVTGAIQSALTFAAEYETEGK